MDEQREAETWLRLGGIAQNHSYGDEAILFFFLSFTNDATRF